MKEKIALQSSEAKRTQQQNRSLHLYFTLLAETLNVAGLDMRVVLKPEIAIEWTPKTVKEKLWKPIQEALLDKKSTTELLKKQDIDKVYDTLHRHLSEKFGAVSEFPPFPSSESKNQLETYNNYKNL
jgi:hypothetical protein